MIKMNIFNKDVIFEIVNHSNYNQLQNMILINKSFYLLCKNEISIIDHQYNKLNVKTMFSAYKVTFPKKIANRYGRSYDSGNAFLFTSPHTPNIKTIISQIVEDNDFKKDDVKNLILTTSTLHLHHPMIKLKYNKIPSNIIHRKVIMGLAIRYNGLAFKLFASGKCQVAGVKDKKEFLKTYNDFMTYLDSF